MSARRQDGLDPKSYEARAKRGRPTIAVSINAETLKKLDALCKRLKCGRGDAIAKLLGD